MAFELPPLPYDKGALAPAMSADTLDFHHGKHHKKYVDTMNELIAGTEFEKAGKVEEVVLGSKKAGKQAIFNNAAQTWNHAFFWNCMTPKGGGEPEGELGRMIGGSFGGLAKFREEFKKAATGQFGSGWAWLVLDGSTLAITATPNAENPLIEGKVPLLTCDVWEHAYYLDYQNRRPDFVEGFLGKLVNWDFAARQLDGGSRFSL